MDGRSCGVGEIFSRNDSVRDVVLFMIRPSTLAVLRVNLSELAGAIDSIRGNWSISQPNSESPATSSINLVASWSTSTRIYNRCSTPASRRVTLRGFEISLATFDLQPPSSLLKLNGRARQVEAWIERTLRVKESSLDPLFRSFRYSHKFPVLPHFPLLLLPAMQTRSRRRAVATPRRPQSVAALLPEEIVDSIFAQFGYDFSTPSWYPAQLGRLGDLSNMSVVAEGWLKPARRLLFSKVIIEEWEHLQETVDDEAGIQVRELEIRDDKMNAVKPAKDSEGDIRVAQETSQSTTPYPHRRS